VTIWVLFVCNFTRLTILEVGKFPTFFHIVVSTVANGQRFARNYVVDNFSTSKVFAGWDNTIFFNTFYIDSGSEINNL
jgi:hypothetical protein